MRGPEPDWCRATPRMHCSPGSPMHDTGLPRVLTFTPLLVPKVWGGRRLEGWGKNLPKGQAIGESWEIADLPGDGPVSVVDAGPNAGTTLRSVLETHPDALMGTARLDAQGRFPLLIKFLDACENLSVQVHPDQAWVDTHPGDHLKSEAWLVLDATDTGTIHAGLTEGMTTERLARCVNDGTVERALRSVSARPGDCHTLVSGTCHALGAGVLVAEVQTTSDTTFRVYDWGRTGRDIHVAQSLACIDPDAAPPCVEAPPLPESGVQDLLLSETPWFSMRRVASAGASWTRPDAGGPTVLMCIAGEAVIDDVTLSRGRTGLVPACAGSFDVTMAPGTVLVRAEPC